jgi:hypothetical protein
MISSATDGSETTFDASEDRNHLAPPTIIPGHRRHVSMNGHAHHEPFANHHEVKHAPAGRSTVLSLPDISAVNRIINNYMQDLIRYMEQPFKGNAQWQNLAYDLFQKLTQLQFIINNNKLKSEYRIANIRQINHEFGKAIQSRVNNDYAQLRERSWTSWLLGVNRISLKDLLLKFKVEDAAKINILLMKYESDFVDYQMDSKLSKVKTIIEKLKLAHPQNRDLNAAEAAFHILYTECHSYPEPLLGKWYVAADRIQKLLENVVQLTPAGSKERMFSAELRTYLTRIHLHSHLRAKPLLIEEPDLGEIRLPADEKAEVKSSAAEEKSRAPIKPETEQQIFERLYNLIEGMKNKLYELCDKPTAPQPLASQVKKHIGELMLKMVIAEQGLEPETYNELEKFSEDWEKYLLAKITDPHTPVMEPLPINYREPHVAEEQKEIIKKHIKRAKLMAVYDFCFYYSNVDLSNLSNGIKNFQRIGKRTLEQVISKRALEKLNFQAKIAKLVWDDTIKVRAAAKKIDLDGSIYAEFLNEKDIENISSITTLQRQHLLRYREQLWQGNSAWQVVAQDLETELDKFQKRLLDKSKKTSFRLAAANEIFNVFDYFIQARVGNQLHQLQQHTIITEGLQLFSAGSPLRKISIKDIFYQYRKNHRPVIEQAIKTIAARLSPEEHRKYVYQTNFRYIYDRLALWVDQLNKYVMKDYRIKADLARIAINLMDSLAKRAEKIYKVYPPGTNISRCIIEADNSLKDVNNAIVGFMAQYYDAQLAPHKALAQADPSGLIKANLLKAFDEVHETLLFGPAKALLIKEIRQAVAYIEPIREMPTVVITKVYEQLPVSKNLSYLLSSYLGTSALDYRRNIDHGAIAELNSRIRIIIDSIQLPADFNDEKTKTWQFDQLTEAKRQIEFWLRHYHPQPEKDTDIAEVMTVFHAQLAEYLSNLNRRFEARAAVEEKISEFDSKEKKNALMAVAYSCLQKIDSKYLRETALEAIESASRYYDENHNEEILLWRFKTEYIDTNNESSGLARILLNFKIYVEVLIKGWLNTIKWEYQAEKEQRIFEAEERRRAMLGDPGSPIQPIGVYSLLTESKNPNALPESKHPQTDLAANGDDYTSLNTTLQSSAAPTNPQPVSSATTRASVPVNFFTPATPLPPPPLPPPNRLALPNGVLSITRVAAPNGSRAAGYGSMYNRAQSPDSSPSPTTSPTSPETTAQPHTGMSPFQLTGGRTNGN